MALRGPGDQRRRPSSPTSPSPASSATSWPCWTRAGSAARTQASDWWKIRGDWDDENTVRFPDGVAGLAAATRAAGVEFGVWCEIEALGFDARIAQAKPEIVARRDDDPDYVGIREDDQGWLGYVCLGSPAGREHVLDVLDRLIGRTGARWLKVDFNLDPGPGCSRTDHGHDAGDGLYEHYVGLYAVLDELRGRHPQLVVEDCSSGGLRLDLGLLAHVHCGFLSDPDWTEFQLQLLWGISQMLPAASIYHFSESQWRGHHPRQHLDPKTISTADYDASLRAVSLHRFALSQKLHELPDGAARPGPRPRRPTTATTSSLPCGNTA